MVLYSRLHLVVHSPKLLFALLFVILGFGVPLQIVMVLAADRVLSEKVWVVTFRLEMIFPFSEILLASLYVFLFIRFMKQNTGGADSHMRRTFYFLVAAEAFVVIIDVIGITLWYLDLYLLRLMVLPFITAWKLKVEFLILNHLTGIGKGRNELRNVTVSVQDEQRQEVQVADSPCTVSSEAPTLRKDANGRDIEICMSNAGLQDEKRPTNSTGKMETSVGVGQEDSSGLDEMDRRYLGRFGGSYRV